jgi:hypothetical protein
MAEPDNKILVRMLERLFAGLLSGPNLNCRPHSSRQRVDLTQLEKLSDLGPAQVLWELLGSRRSVKVAAKVPLPKRLRKNSVAKKHDPDSASANQSLTDVRGSEKSADQPLTNVRGSEKTAENELTPEEREAQKKWSDQQSLLSKFRILADESRTYEQDTGVHALNVGFPLLSLPPGSMKASGDRSASRRVVAPIAFIPVTITIHAGAAPTIEIACKGEGVDLVAPNMALLAWLEQQSGSAAPELFADEKGQDPWREIGGLMQHVAKTLSLSIPVPLQELLPASQPPLSPPPLPVSSPPASLVREGEAPAEPRLPARQEPRPPEPTPAGEHNAPAAPDPKTQSENHATATEPAVIAPVTASDPLVPSLEKLQLQAAPRADDEESSAAIIPAAVLGLFPMNNQGLLRDMQAMVAGESRDGPVRSFIDVGVSLDEPQETKYDHEAWSGQKRRRSIPEERFVTLADPCQARAVRLARECRGLVIHGPPGTGKSQTITNVIGDHLARGERVLLVCDKRTALDVVANRMEAMGLRSLCAQVYDAQRDQRELYRSMRDQLEALTEAKSDEFADKKLAKVDAELGKLHAELTESWSLPAEKEGGKSFHDLMGQWLSIPESAAVKLDTALLKGAESDAFEKHEHDLTDILARGEAIGFGCHVWKDGAGTSLSDFLARPMDHWRQELAQCLDSAKNTDATLDDSIPPFNAAPSLEEQAAARIDLARQIETVGSQALQAVLERWVNQDLETLRRMRRKLADAGLALRLLGEAPGDAELSLVAQTERLGLPAISQQLGVLEAYLAIAGKWYGWLFFKRRARAAEVLGRYGLPPGAEAGSRLRTFLSVLRARLVVQSLHAEFTGVAAAQVETILDADLVWAASLHAAFLDLLTAVQTTPALQGLPDRVHKALVDPSVRPGLIDGLRKSEKRASSITMLRTRLTQTGLFDAVWLGQTSVRIAEGQTATAILTPLVENLQALETVLRIRTLLGNLPPQLQAPARTLLDQNAPAVDGVAALRKGVLAAQMNDRLQNQQKLRSLDPQRLRASFDRYRELEQAKQGLVRDAVLHRWTTRQKERLLVGTGSRLNSAGADLRRRLTLRGERALRLRQVVSIGQSHEGGDPLFDLRPVWLASPETVAQIFPRRPLFDAVVFDEASQCRLEEALPVLTRAQRVVIAGDPKQLPPTRFFETAVTVSEDDEVESDQQLFEVHQGEIEDLLGAALSIDIQQCYLDVHYRSYNADLIQFSNQQFYSSRLQPIPGHPSNRSRFAPITLYRADGVYEDRTNPKEAEQVCHIVRDLLKRADPPSIGIACFNVTQRDLIVEKLDELAQEDREFAVRLADARTRRGPGSFEGLFVKNLENVQGDERDHIIISTTYGPDAKGRFYRRFGPVGQAGGGRRLNVLVTRAREEVHLVTSIPPNIYRNLPPVPSGQTPGGGWLLFAYLRFAEQLADAYERIHQRLDVAAADAPPEVHVRPSQAPSLFAQALAQRLALDQQVGSEVHWGNDGFCIDVALHHPRHADDVTIGVLCDGTRFTQAEDPVEWDIFRTSVLESQGWALHRLWTPHFFRDPQGCTQTILSEAAQQANKTEAKDTIKVEKGGKPK